MFDHQPELIKCPIVKLKLGLGKRVASVYFLVSDRVQMELRTPGLHDTVSLLKQEKVKLADDKAADELDDIVAVIATDMGIICGGTYPPPFLFRGDNISTVPPLPLFSSKFYITDAGNEAINNIKYLLNTNKYKILK